MLSFVKIGPMVLEMMVFQIRQCIFVIMSGTLHLNKLESPLPKNGLCQEINQVEMIFQIRQCIFAIISPWKSAGSYI